MFGTTKGSTAGGSLAALHKGPVGTIHKEDYSVTSGSASNSNDIVHRAAMHKRHRNRGDKLVYGKNVHAPLDALVDTGVGVALGSQYDNEHVSHTIPRTNDQVPWIKAITELDQSYLEHLDPNGGTYSALQDILESGAPVKYLGEDQSGTESGV